MLIALAIRNVVLIEAAELRFVPGLNVLTGETGAGKSILLDALGFVLGWRGRAELVRAGAAQGEVSAAFVLPSGHPARAILADAGLPDPEEELLLRRVATPDGRRQAYVNDRRVSVETLRGLADALVELHGQADDRGLLDPRGHRALLDAFAGTEAELDAVRAAWAARTEAARALAEAEARLAEAGRDADYLRHAATELERLGPEPGEEAALDARRRTLRATERIREDVVRAAEALGPDGAEGRLIDAMRWLERAAPQSEGALDAALDAIPRTLAELAEATGALAALLDADAIDAGELERVEERLFTIRAAARKHQVDPEALPDLAADLRRRLEMLDAGASGVTGLAAALSAAEAAHADAAAVLSGRRRAAAARLDARMAEELPPLKLERARFVTELAPADPGPDGVDRVAFLVATTPGATPGPIGRIASGGELSRFLLALKVCLSARAEGITLIFDEIDRGVGGATADAVGRRLAALGASAQVLVVTHAPQVAARGVSHWQVGKQVSSTRARTEVVPLDEGARVEEIARMLAGDVVTEAARAAARALLAG
ncbi:DNA repair protein RecN [Amaricoccus sp.]|uniref:DNA repair protein RecN n=1 Tax=Amaricoccus sp. TaxID=1872485 RepID=UPI001B3CB468|nr:DNA repair protein RecN [Amaricoccus sp.]MBP7242728.1 DNA repair protein RecN [Amaricoccus sp.]